MGEPQGLHLSNYVLAETYTLLGRRIGCAQAARDLDLIRASRLHVVHWVQEDLHREALELFRQAERRGPSFTDCTSFALMRRLGLTTAFTFDRDFADAGFQMVPRA